MGRIRKICSILMATLLVVTHVLPIHVFAEDAEIIRGLQERYVLVGEEVDLLDGVSATYEEEDLSLKVTDVKTESGEDAGFALDQQIITFTQTGKYIVTYEAKKEESVLATGEKTFVVEEDENDDTTDPTNSSGDDNLALTPAAAPRDGLLGSTGFEDFVVGVRDYNHENGWIIEEAKYLDIKASNLSNEKYTIEIVIKKGLYLHSFPWNDVWGTVPTATGFLRTPEPMQNNTKQYFTGHTVSFDPSTLEYTLRYDINPETDTAPLIGQIALKPEPHFAYIGQSLTDAIVVKLLDSSNSVVKEGKMSINIVRGTDTSDGIVVYWNHTAVTPGVDEMNLGTLSIKNRLAGVQNNYVGTVNELVYPLPECVETITKVNIPSTFTDASWEWNATNHTLIIKNLVPKIPYQNYDGVSLYDMNVFGKVKANTPQGTYNTTNYNNDKGAFKITTLYGTVLQRGSSAESSSSNWGGTLRVGTAPNGVIGYKGNLDKNDLKYEYSKSRVEGYPTNFSFSDGGGFYTPIDLTADQIATWSFEKDTFDVIGVPFPTQNAKKVVVTSLTVVDEAGKETALTDLNLEFIPPSSGSFSGVCYVDMRSLKDKESRIPANAKYIRSITANCGTFNKNYSAPTGGQDSRLHTPVGYLSKAILDVDYAYKDRPTIKYYFTVNNVKRVFEDTVTSRESIEIITDIKPSQTTIKSGTTFNIDAAITFHAVSHNTAVAEPELFVVVPDDVLFNPAEVTAGEINRTTGQYEAIAKDRIVHEGPFTTRDGHTYYIFHVKDSVISIYAESDSNRRVSPYDAVKFELPWTIKSIAKSQEIILSDYLFAGKRIKPTENEPSKFAWQGQSIMANTTYDIWDLDNDGKTDDTDSFKSTQNIKVNVVEDEDLLVMGYLTNHGETGAIEAYKPGEDGSTDTGAVVFSTGQEIDFHVIVKNTMQTAGAIPSSIEAYIPIPNASINGSVVTPKNTGTGVLSVGESTKLQFNNYNWPMKLTEKVTNPNPEIFEIKYWLNSCDLDAEYGMPKVNEQSVIIDEGSMTDNDPRLSQVILVEIISSDVPTQYNIDEKKEFIITCGVDVSADEAMSADINGTKNIFRSAFHRVSSNGGLYLNGDWVAAKLSVAKLSGIAFKDDNGNSIYDTGDSLLPGVTVQLLDDQEVKIAEMVTDDNGEYSFEDLHNGDYIVRFLNNLNEDGFAQSLSDTVTNYQVNSDAEAASDNSYADIPATLPFVTEFDKAQLYLNAGFVDMVEVKIVNSEPSRGSINTTTQNILKGYAVDIPIPQPIGKNVFDQWKDSNGVIYLEGTPITEPTTLTAWWKNIINFENTPGGSLSGSIEHLISDGGKIMNIPATSPDKKKTFVGWISGDKTYTNDEISALTIYDDITFTAKWADDENDNNIDDSTEPKYSITYTDGVDNEVIFADVNHIVLVGLDTPEFNTVPTRKGYDFLGWNPTVTPKVLKTVTYTATWIVKTYDITYELKGGKNAPSNPATYTVEDEITLENATMPGYIFGGWEPASIIEKGSIDAKVFTVKDWTPITYTIRFVDDAGKDISDPITATFDQPVQAPDCSIDEKGYDIEGWTDGALIYKEGDNLLNLTTINKQTVILKPNKIAFTYDCVEGKDNVWIKGSNVTSDFIFKRSRNDERTSERKVEIQVDGKVVDSSNYEEAVGSWVVNLKPDYLQGLSNGRHTIKAVFSDGEATANFTINPSVSPNNNPTPKPKGQTCQDIGYTQGYYWNGTACVVDARVSIPNTGDDFNGWIYLFTGMTAMIIAFFAALQLRKHSS